MRYLCIFSLWLHVWRVVLFVSHYGFLSVVICQKSMNITIDKQVRSGALNQTKILRNCITLMCKLWTILGVVVLHSCITHDNKLNDFLFIFFRDSPFVHAHVHRFLNTAKCLFNVISLYALYLSMVWNSNLNRQKPFIITRFFVIPHYTFGVTYWTHEAGQQMKVDLQWALQQPN